MNIKSLSVLFLTSSILVACSSNNDKDFVSKVAGAEKVIKEAKANHAKNLSKKEGQFVPDRVFFGTDESSISEDAAVTSQLQAELIKNDGVKNVTISGYCDERGGIEYNQALGEKRATALKSALEKLGVNTKINVISFGK